MTTHKSFVHVAVLSAPMRQSYSYRWPFLDFEAQKGLRVLVPFGRTRRMALVLAVTSKCEIIELKDVLDILDERPLYPETWQRFLSRMQSYYVASHAALWHHALAWAAKDEQCSFYCADWQALTTLDAPLAQMFKQRKTRQVQAIRKSITDACLRLRQACQAGMVQAVIPALESNRVTTKPLKLHTAQQEALDHILNSQGFSPFLLFGVTGSGKTEVYLQAIAHHVAQSQQVLVLVPEIGLIPQWMICLKQRFRHVGQWHSGMTAKQRLAVRLNLACLDIIIGTRSALFLPLARLSLLVVDEEHDASFKQQDGLRYSARDMAVLLAHTLNLPIVLGSATPSLESWHKAKQGAYQLLRLAKRISAQATAQPEIIDLRHRRDPLSSRLLEAVQATQAQQQQSLLFLNRRGYAPSLYCCDCTHILQCSACSTSLTVHLKQQQLRCHTCGFRCAMPLICPACQSDTLKPLGVGTERVLQQLQEHLPNLRIEVLDRDRVSSEKVLHQLLQDFRSGAIDCLVGTQMLVKGHHFPNVGLVGVVHADLGLNMPDFRATERWWQQLTQVLGRTGRGQHTGRVLIQTLHPEGEWLQQLGDQHAQQVLDQTLMQRKVFAQPPFARWVRIIFSAIFMQDAAKAAEHCANYIQQQDWHIQCLAASPCVMERQAGRFRYEVVLRDPSRQQLPWCLTQLVEVLPISAKIRWVLDVDPYDMM